MKRWILFVGLIGLGLFARSAPVSASSLDNFVITNYEVQMKLGRDDARRSTLETKLTITADFPPDQNHGLSKFFVKDYNGHDTSLKVKSVQDENGKDLDYHWNDDEMRIGDKNTYVSGKKTYVIEYTQRDVTRFYSDTGKHEFYWDVIGTQWRVPIEKAQFTLDIDSELAGEVTTQLNCYRGKAGSNQKCGDVLTTLNNPITNYRVAVEGLDRREGMTVAIGFGQDSFKPFEKSLGNKIIDFWGILQGYLTLPAVIITLATTFMWRKVLGRHKELEPIAPEYLPPDYASVTDAGGVYKRTAKKGRKVLDPTIATAQMIDLTVRHYLKIYEVPGKLDKNQPDYHIEVQRDLMELKPAERSFVVDIFGRLPKIGDKFDLSLLEDNEDYAERRKKALQGTEYDLKRRGFMKNRPDTKKKIGRWAKLLLILTIVTLSPVLIIPTVGLYLLADAESLTDNGLKLLRYLEGLKMYIAAAEKERLNMLQSPAGAEKVGRYGDTKNPKSLVKLYEKVLPYAILFGQEKQWAEQMSTYYHQSETQPDWYNGQEAFSAAAFAASMNNLSSSVSSGAGSTGSSSSFGGSSGGGFSGGGGGGGGGGGW